MKITDEAKNQDGDIPASNGNLSQDEEDLELQKTFENQNGTNSNESRDSGSPIDTIPFNIEGIQTVVKNSSDNSKTLVNGASSQSLLEAELQRYKEENAQLKAALKEASRVNQQWRSYHDQRQGYVQKLLSSLHDLQQTTSLKQENGNLSSIELQRLRESFTHQKKEHNEHIQLLQMQVRAHRDDWEAERSEKKAAEIGRIQAETQFQITHSQLEEAKNSILELEGRIKLCRCFAGSSFIAGGNTERLSQSFRQHNGNLAPADAVSRISPSFSVSANSACSSTSRSSSVSRELSANSSPTIMKNLQPSPPIGVNLEVNGAVSPPIRVPSRTSVTKSNDCQHTKENMEDLPQKMIPICLHNNKQEDLISNLFAKEQQNYTDANSKVKLNGTTKIESTTENDMAYYEPKGARPKNSSVKNSEEEERKAKRRARSILASALPMSPTGSKPSSPVTVSSSHKGSYIPKGYIPITSTVLTPVRLKMPSSVKKNQEQSKLQKLNGKNTINFESTEVSFDKLTESSKACYFNNDSHCNTQDEIEPAKNSNQKQHKLHQSKQSKTESSENNGGTSCKSKGMPSCRTNIKLINGHVNEGTGCNQCSSIHINEISMSNVSPCDFHGLCNTESGIIASSHCETSSSKESLEIKTAAKMKQNTKSLLVTNNHEKCNTNYASITVMPGPSSALYSHTQTTSTTLPQSSSPGISLTTFALNANGQGVPGAIFFALGTDTKPLKNSQQQQNSAINTEDAQDEITKNNLMIAKEPHDESSNERIVNSAWVQLTDTDCNSTRLTQKTPWRTARAVPSHKLNSVRKTHAGDNGSIGTSPTFSEELRKNDNFYHSYSYGNSTMCHCNGNNHSKYHQSYESRYQTSFSPPPTTYGNCPRISPSISITPPQSLSHNDCRNGDSPTICVVPHSTFNQSCAESDLRSKASKNISSAILSYECGNLGCRTLHARKVVNDRQNCASAIEEKLKEIHTKAELNTESYLICPSCQKLYISANTSIYEQHIQACGGPKYADM